MCQDLTEISEHNDKHVFLEHYNTFLPSNTDVISSTKRIHDSISRDEVCLIVSVSLTAEDEGGLFRKLSTSWKLENYRRDWGWEIIFFFSRITSGIFRNSSKTP